MKINAVVCSPDHMKKATKMIAILLAIVMILSIVPFATAHAENIEEVYSFDEVAHNSQKKSSVGMSPFAAPMEISSLASYAPDSESMIGNSYVEFYVGKEMDTSMNDGRFTIGNTGGNPNYPADDNKILLYAHPSPWSSYTTIRINDVDYIFNSNNTTYDIANLRAVSTMTVDGVLVTQTLQIVDNASTGLKDTVQISYSAINQSSSAKAIGIRIMMDTMLGDNDGAPFKVPSLGNVTYERELSGNAIPQFWQAFDNLTNPSVFAVGTLYKTGDRRPDKVQFAYWSEIYDSVNSWNYTINTSTPVTSDSAVAVYWNPVSVAAGNSVTSSTYYGVGFSDGTSGSSTSTANVGVNEYAVEVRAKNGSPISGASVTINGIGSATSNSGGIAKFSVSNTASRKITVSASGYQTIEAIRSVAKGTAGFIVLNIDDGKPYIKSITLDDTLCLLSSSKNFQSDTNNSATSKVVIIADPKDVTNLRYRLMQSGLVIAENSTGVFDIPIQKDFKKDAPIYAYVASATGGTESAKFLTGIKVVGGTVSSSGANEFSIGEKVSFSLPDDWPIIGGDTVEFGFEGFPLQVDVDGDTIKVAIGITKDSWSNGSFSDDQNDRFWSDLKREYTKVLSQRVTDRMDAARAFGGKPSGFGAGRVKLDVQVLGYGEARQTSGNTFIDIGLYVKVKGEAGYTQYFFLGFVPFYASIQGGVEGDLRTTLQATFQNGSFLPSSVTFPAIEFTLTPYINPSLGVGAQGVLSLEIGGKISFPLNWDFANKYFEARANGKIYAQATAFLFSAKIEKELFDPVIGSKYWGQTVSGASASLNPFEESNFNAFNLFDTDNYSIMSRDYVNKTTSASFASFSPMSFGANNTDTLQSNVFPQSQPQIVAAGGKQYLFWLDDGAFHGISRSDENRTVLMYSVFDGSAWGPALAVDDDGTADFYFDVASDGTDVFAAWTNSKEVFAQDVTLEEMVAAMEITVAKINNSAVVETHTITDNAYGDMLPAVSINSTGNVFAAWIERESNNIFESINGISTSKYDGTVWTTPTKMASENSKQIISMDSGVFENKFAVAYTLDDDGDYDTKADREIYVIKDEDPAATKLGNDFSVVSNPQFGKMNGQPAVYWFDNSNISYVASGAALTINQVFDEPQGHLTDRFSVVSDDQNTYVFWTVGTTDEDEEDTTDVFVAKYDANTWTQSVKIAEVDANASELSGIINTSNRPELVLSDRDVSNDIYRVLHLEIIPEPDIALIDVYYDMESAGSGASLPISLFIENKSLDTVTEVNVEISNSSTLIYTGVIPAIIPSGEEREVRVDDFVLPSFSAVSEYTVKAYVQNEQDLSNNEIGVLIGYTDIELTVDKYLSADEWFASVTFENKTGMPTNTTFRIFADEDNGAILFEERLGVIEKGTNTTMTFDLAQLTAGTNVDTMIFSVVADNEEFYTLNNTEIVVYGANTLVASYTITATAGTGGTVTGGGIYDEGDDVTLTAAPGSNYFFDGWYENGTKITGAGVTYTFAAATDRTLEARFAYSGRGGSNAPATPSHSFSGGNSQFTKGSETPLALTIQKDFSLFRDVQMGGNVLARDTQYKAESGSTVIALFADYLDTLPAGQYTLEVRFIDGATVDANFMIAEGEQAIPTPTPEPTPALTPEQWVNPFADVRESDWFYEAVKYAHQNGLVAGTSATTFSPQVTMTRGMMVTILWNYSGKPQMGNPVFTDVADGARYAGAVNWAAANGIVSGYGNGLFGPNDEITREQMAVLLYNYTKFIGDDLPKKRIGAFVDDAQISTWAKEAVDAMYAAEILNGKGNNDFDPRGRATRAEVVAMMRNFFADISVR